MIVSTIISVFSITIAVAAQDLVPLLTLPDCPVGNYYERTILSDKLTILPLEELHPQNPPIGSFFWLS